MVMVWTIINRELKKFQRLKSYFLSEDIYDAISRHHEKAFSIPMTEFYGQFFQSSFVTFTSSNKYQHRENPLIYLKQFQVNSSMNKLASRFIKSEAIQALNESNQLFCELNDSLNDQKPDQELFIGHAAKQKLTELLIEDIGNSECNRL